MASREDGSTTTFVVRYPDGSREFRMNQSFPREGDVLAGRGKRWIVATVVEHARDTFTISLQPLAADA